MNSRLETEQKTMIDCTTKQKTKSRQQKNECFYLFGSVPNGGFVQRDFLVFFKECSG